VRILCIVGFLCSLIKIASSFVVIGYKDKKDGKVKKLRIPFEPGSEVFLAKKEFISEIVSLPTNIDGAYIGKLEGQDIPIILDLNKLLTKHVAILAKSGAGKSYTVGVLLEEIIERKIPLLILDPHGEYSSMRFENTDKSVSEAMATFNITPKKYPIREYGDPSINNNAIPLRLSDQLTPSELVELLPVKLSNSQMGLMYSATNNLDSCDLESVLYQLGLEESSVKWTLMGIIEQLRDANIFSSAPTPHNELLKPGTASIINFRGIDPSIQEIITTKLLKDLFELRKKGNIPPFFLVVEEAHNFCPERSFGEKKSSKILRTIASEGRKFGLGLGIISQRPARVDKSVISQCSTQNTF